MKYNYKYGILFKFNPTMDLILNTPIGWITILDLFENNTREYRKGDKINITYNKGNNKKLFTWYDKEGYNINLMLTK